MKSKGLVCGLLISAFGILFSCSDNEGKEPENNGTSEEPVAAYEPIELGETRTCVDDGNTFAFNLLGCASELDVNTVVSPLSVYSVLSMLANGDSGASKAEIMSMMGFADDLELSIFNEYCRIMSVGLTKVDPLSKFKLANGIWYNPKFSIVPEFGDNLTNSFGASLNAESPGGLTGMNSINNWVSINTEGMIDAILTDPLDTEVDAAIVNALVFSGKWCNNFDKVLTKDGAFYNFDGTKGNAMFMNQENRQFYVENDKYEGAVLPLGNSSFFMYFIMPKDGVSATVVPTASDFKELQASTSICDMTLSLPKFKTESSSEIIDILRKLGLNACLDQGFNSILVNRNLKLRIFKHVAQVEVDEDGVVGAAASLGGMAGDTGDELKKKTFSFNHPFFWALCERTTGVVVLTGVQNKF